MGGWGQEAENTTHHRNSWQNPVAEHRPNMGLPAAKPDGLWEETSDSHEFSSVAWCYVTVLSNPGGAFTDARKNNNNNNNNENGLVAVTAPPPPPAHGAVATQGAPDTSCDPCAPEATKQTVFMVWALAAQGNHTKESLRYDSNLKPVKVLISKYVRVTAPQLLVLQQFVVTDE
ncbi:hypothetical protein ACRRTK_016405 [Alexandromys fortis]